MTEVTVSVALVFFAASLPGIASWGNPACRLVKSSSRQKPVATLFSFLVIRVASHEYPLWSYMSRSENHPQPRTLAFSPS